MIFFFFSSRRRHTRFKCDWSSDVCSSDLMPDSVHQMPAPMEKVLASGLSAVLATFTAERRSEERRVGKECRSRWWPCHLKKKAGRDQTEFVAEVDKQNSHAYGACAECV